MGLPNCGKTKLRAQYDGPLIAGIPRKGSTVTKLRYWLVLVLPLWYGCSNMTDMENVGGARRGALTSLTHTALSEKKCAR